MLLRIFYTFVMKLILSFTSVAPDAIHQHVRTCREHINVRNMHFVAPEYASKFLYSRIEDAKLQ